MSQERHKTNFDDPVTDEGMTDTSIFDADEIVRKIESVAATRKSVVVDSVAASRRRFEALQEEKRLKAELRDLDDYDIGDYDIDNV